MKQEETNEGQKGVSMTAEINKDTVRSNLDGHRTELITQRGSLSGKPSGEAEPVQASPGATTGETKKEDRTDISDDIEKDINIDVNINNNSSSTIQYTSNITINYYNYEGEGQKSSDEMKTSTDRSAELEARIKSIQSKTGFTREKLTRMAYELLVRKLEGKKK